ncbi:MAG: metal-dependent transcriptional regulator [Nitrospinota bacterium]|nr:metal-dependent transcriptional regulator [Nitrospinota bacterium]
MIQENNFFSNRTEDYLKNIFKLEQSCSPVKTSSIATKMQLSSASVTGMLKKLHRMKLVVYKPYQGVTLTKKGEKVALEIIRHHRLIELFLNQKMGIDWDKVDIEAEKLEHVLSEELEEVLDKSLGFPTLDPHGDPIPSKGGSIKKLSEKKLFEIEEGKETSVIRVGQDNNKILKYLGEIGLIPGVSVEILEKSVNADTITISVNGISHTFSNSVGSSVFVS